MSDPPFAVPRGMQWDREKRRFFRITAQVGAASDASVRSKGQGNRRDRGNDHRGRRQDAERRAGPKSLKLVTFSPFRSAQPIGRMTSANVNTLCTLRIRSTLSSARLRDIVIVQAAARLSSEDIAAQDTLRDLHIHSLSSCTSLGALLSFQSAQGNIFFVDLSRTTAAGATAIHTFGDIDTFAASPLAYQEHQCENDRSSAQSGQMLALCDMIHQQIVPGQWCAVDQGQFIRLSRDFSMELSTAMPKTTTTPTDRRQVAFQRFLIPRKHPRIHKHVDEIHINLRRCETEADCVTDSSYWKSAFSSSFSRNITIWIVTQSSDESEPRLRGAYSAKVTSDILCHDANLTGDSVMLGCRNGQMYRCKVRDSRHIADSTEMQRIPAELLPCRGVGAITNIKFVSRDEVLVAESSGQLRLISTFDSCFETLQTFSGHVNSWTLHPAMTVDPDYRIFALAGQDKRVRVWSLDDARPIDEARNPDRKEIMPFDLVATLPLGKSQTPSRLQECTFADDVRGLAFVPRRDVRAVEDQQNYRFAPRGIPALAVTCGSSRIAIFE